MIELAGHTEILREVSARHRHDVQAGNADVVITIPELILALAITAVLGRSLTNTMLAIGLVRWPI